MYKTVCYWWSNRSVLRPHLVLACGFGPEPGGNWRADRRYWTLCRRPAGRTHRGLCRWCRTAGGRCFLASMERKQKGQSTVSVWILFCRSSGDFQTMYACDCSPRTLRGQCPHRARCPACWGRILCKTRRGLLFWRSAWRSQWYQHTGRSSSERDGF